MRRILFNKPPEKYYNKDENNNPTHMIHVKDEHDDVFFSSSKHRGNRRHSRRETTKVVQSCDVLIRLLFRSSYAIVIAIFLLFYFLLVLLYTFAIYGISYAYGEEHECLGDSPFFTGTFREKYEISFSLSWTTFSTVGYGTISTPDTAGCLGLRYLLASEAFLGVLYAGFCGAIFYSKVGRLITTAPVTLSRVVCCQYGTNMSSDPTEPCLIDEIVDKDDNDDNDGDDDDGDDDDNRNKNKDDVFPFLEFRIINDKMRFKYSELYGAQIVVTVESFEIADKKRLAHNYEKDNYQDETTSANTNTTIGTLRYYPIRRNYKNVVINPDKHPVFESVWHFRHYLNDKSPFLNKSLRKQIATLGRWPIEELNDYKSIRSSFDTSITQIHVTFKAMSNLTSQNVYKIFQLHLNDIYIGWQFANMIRISLLSSSNKSTPPLPDSTNNRMLQIKRGVFVDPTLLNCIIPQKLINNDYHKEQQVEEEEKSEVEEQYNNRNRSNNNIIIKRDEQVRAGRERQLADGPGAGRTAGTIVSTIDTTHCEPVFGEKRCTDTAANRFLQ